MIETYLTDEGWVVCRPHIHGTYEQSWLRAIRKRGMIAYFWTMTHPDHAIKVASRFKTEAEARAVIAEILLTGDEVAVQRSLE